MDLSELDPGSQDERYWAWFHQTVMTRAVAELALRRELARQTVSDVLASWSRSLVPAALVAASVATIMTISAHKRSTQVPVTPVAFDEVLDGAAMDVVTAELFGDLGDDPSDFMALVEREDQ